MNTPAATVPDWTVPHMDDAGFARFRAVLAGARCYLEYGAGGSTVHACNEARVPLIVSVDTDPRWVGKVCAQLHRGPPGGVAVLHCDVGPVGDWGVPTSRDRFADFWRYMVLPWEIADSSGLVPDAVLVDGRFRVASFLFTLAAARPGTTVLFDDYANRPEYHLVEGFCAPRAIHGRMAEFVTEPVTDHARLSAWIARYATVWD